MGHDVIENTDASHNALGIVFGEYQIIYGCRSHMRMENRHGHENVCYNT